MDKQETTGIKVILPTKQTKWKWPAVANFILGGAGAGFYLLSFINMVFEQGISITTQPILFGMLSPLLIVLGFILLTTEAGRPSRSRYLLRNMRSAWISKETLGFTFFAPAVIFDHFFPHLIFKACAAFSALFFMVAQGFILYSSRAVPTWNVFIMPLFFISSGFVSGSGTALLLTATGGLPIRGDLVLISLIFTIINLVIWICYLRWSSANGFQSATEALRRPFMIFIIIALGHAFPILMLLLLQIQPYIGMEKTIPCIFPMVTGLALIIGVAAQKAGIVLSTGYTRGVDLKF